MSVHALTHFLLGLIVLCGLAQPLQAQRTRKAADSAVSAAPAPKHYLDTLGLGGLKFRSIGPAVTSGRVSDFAVHPQRSSTYYVASASGGVWKTVNAGTTYEPIFDGQGSYSIGCVTLDPNNPNVVWVGTGENNNQRSVAYGDGLYKSLDGGSSWTHAGLKQSEHIGKILIDPRNSDVVYVAAIGPLWSAGGERGVYKSTDGGKTWTASLTIDQHTGVNDIVMDPRNPDVLYAASYQRRRHVFTYVGGGPGSDVYKSTDGGKTWNKANQGLPAEEKGRIALAISPANPEIIYAMVETAGDGNGFYCSTNRGASWEKRSGFATSGNYYMEMTLHPTNPDIIFAMDTWLHWSTDGGRSFSMVNEQYKHVDNHCMWIDPLDPSHYLVGCDGGIYESWDAAQTWDFKANLPVTQFYKVAVDNAEPFYYVYGGTQDNFSLGGPSRTRSMNGIVNDDWFVTNGGDGFESQVDPNNPNIVYAQSQYGVLVRYDKATGEQLGIQPKPRAGEAEYRWNWDAPLAISAHNPTRIYFSANKLFRSDDRGSSWQVLGDDLTRQVDRNALKVMDRVQSIDAVAKNQSTSPYGTIVAFSESPLSADLLYVGTDDGLIQVSEDGGRSWTRIDVNGIPGAPERTYVNYLLASQHDANVVYAAFNHHKYGDFKPYVYKSTDKGRTWKAITANLPERGSSYSLAEDHVDRNLLFVGTEFGCFFTPDGGAHWKQLRGGLPTIAVRDMAIQKRENDLVLATFGRGFYVLDNYSPLRQVNSSDLAVPAKIFPIKDGLLFVESAPLGLRGKGFQGHSYFSTPNPPVGAVFTYYIRDAYKSRRDLRRERESALIAKGQDVRYPTYEELQAEEREEAAYLLLTIADLNGQVVRQLKTGLSTGVQRLVWDGRYPSVNPVNLNRSSFDNPFESLDEGVLAMPGDYTVSLARSIDGKIEQLVAPQRFTLRTLGGVTLPAADRPALVAFQREAQELQRNINGASQQLGEIGNRMRHIRQAIYNSPAAAPELISNWQKLDAALDELRKSLYGDGLATQLDQPTQMTIAGRMGWLTYEMWSSTSAPTQTQRDALSISKEGFNAWLPKLRTLIEQDLPALERKLEASGAPYTPGRRIEWKSGN